jgi:hypothetical protein
MHKLKIFAAALVAAAGLALPARATVTTTCTNESYTGNGATVDFSFPCKFLDNSHLVVKVNSVTQLLTTNYTVTGAGTSSGNVHFLTAPANALSVTIQRVTPLTQSTSLNQSRNLNPAAIEAMADRDILIAQELNDGALSQNSVALTGNVSAQQYNRRCMVDQYTGADLGVKLAAAIADSNCTSKIYDMSGLGTSAQTLSGNVSLSVTGGVFIFPNARINMGANQVIVPVGTHSVTMLGGSSYGSTANGNTVVATNFFYTGAGAAIVFGDGSADTLGVKMGNFTVNLAGAGVNAIGVQMNRLVDYTLETVSVAIVSTQKGFDLEGAPNQTSGVMLHPRVDAGPAATGSGIYFGEGAAANTIVGAHIAMGNIGGTCFNFDGGGAASGGNHIVGGDCENATNAIRMDFSSYNTSGGFRTENCTNVLNATANSGYSHFETKGSQSMAVINAGVNNSTTDTYWTQIGRNDWKMKNSTDTASTLTLLAGLTVDQSISILMQGFGTDWRIQKTAADVFQITHQSTGIQRAQYQLSNTNINAEAGGGIILQRVGELRHRWRPDRERRLR